MTPVTHKNPRSAKSLVSWSESLPLWQRDALRRIALQGFLNEGDVEDLRDALLAEHELRIFSKFLAPLEDKHCKAFDDASGVPLLCSIGPVKNVNRLAENQPPLRFNQSGITLIYGDNGTGKSGYCRIAKKVCRAQGDESILGNAFTGNSLGEPTARIRWRPDISQDVQEFDWSLSHEPPKALSLISVFNSKNADRYVDGENQLIYLPFEVDMVRQLTMLCDELREYLRNEIAITSSGIIDLPDFTPDTPASAVMERLKNAIQATSIPNIEEIETLSQINEAEELDLQKFKRELTSDPIHQADIRARCAGATASIAESLKQLESKFSDVALSDLKEKYQALVAAKAASDAAASKEFLDMPLDHVGSDIWQTFFKYARVYSELAYPEHDFPYVGTDARCVLCQQELDEDARQRFVRFDDFIEGKAAQELEERSKILSMTLTELNEIAILTNEEIRQRLAEYASLDEKRKTAADNIASTFEAFSERLEAMISAATVSGDFNVPPCPAYFTKLSDDVRNLHREEEHLRTTKTDNTVFQNKAKRFRELGDRKTIKTNKNNILRFRTDTLKLARLEECLHDVRTDQLSRKVTELRRTHVTDKLNEKISKEIESLGLSYLNVKVVDQTSKGVSKFFSDIGLKQKSRKHDVLSEGEQRALALACFLAEADITPEGGGLIIDDPVSSLDQERTRRVAERLVQTASEGRQVIIFTHNLVFYQEVRSAAATVMPQVTINLHVIRNSAELGFGIVEENALPQLARKLKDKISQLQNNLNKIKSLDSDTNDTEEYNQAAHAFYGNLRRTWERLVEELLLGGVVERFNSDVKTQSLKEVVVDDLDYHQIFHAMKRVSEYSGHEQATAKKIDYPDYKFLRNDLDFLIGYRKKLIDRRKNISEARRKLETAPEGHLE